MKIEIKPAHLTQLEQIFIVKIFIQSFPHRSKLCLMLGSLSRQNVSYHVDKWLPMWATYGSCASLFPMPHDFYAKEIPDYYRENGLENITHFLDGKM